jgi:prolyl-tRNA synthetase
VLVRRDTAREADAAAEGIGDAIEATLEALQSDLFERARKDRDSRSSSADSLDEVGSVLKERPGSCARHWCGSAECEAKVKAGNGRDAAVHPAR